VTGPTGDLGIAIVSALERSRRVKRIVGMARRPFDPKGQGWRKTEYRQGDVQDQGSVRDAVRGADVVVHLAFTVIQASEATRRIPYFQLSERLPEPVRGFLSTMPALKPVIPDVGPKFQLVHEDDVASAFVAGVLGRGSPGPYNLAARGPLAMRDVADALGWYSFPVPDAALEATAEFLSRIPALPSAVSWLHAVRTPVLMRTTRAQKKLGWRPKHTGKATLK